MEATEGSVVGSAVPAKFGSFLQKFYRHFSNLFATPTFILLGSHGLTIKDMLRFQIKIFTLKIESM